jgi:NAD(P)-dependent dehydrogenase (short-subunit alcohol dehydrogenase family)
MSETNKGKTVYVAGGARGIGRSIVSALAADGYDVILSYRGSVENAAKICDELSGKYPDQSISSVQVDMSDHDQVEQLATRISETESLYGLVYNAGGSYDSLAVLADQLKAEALFQINFWAMTRLTAAAARPLMRAKAGRIVTIGSVTSQLAVSGNAMYAASKGAMLSYIRTLAVELARKGVTANYISPGYVDTDLLAPYADYRDNLEKQIPLRRFAQPEEVGELTRFLLSPLAGYITGSVIPIDGGLTAGLLIQR